MRAAILPALLAISCAVAPGGPASVQMTTIASGGYALSGERGAAVATSEAEYRRLWDERIGPGEGQPPQADFKTGVVIFLLSGTRNTGGWAVEPQSVVVEGDTAVMTAIIKRPPAGSIVTQALTSPYAVVHVGDRSVRKVRWAE